MGANSQKHTDDLPTSRTCSTVVDDDDDDDADDDDEGEEERICMKKNVDAVDWDMENESVVVELSRWDRIGQDRIG